MRFQTQRDLPIEAIFGKSVLVRALRCFGRMAGINANDEIGGARWSGSSAAQGNEAANKQNGDCRKMFHELIGVTDLTANDKPQKWEVAPEEIGERLDVVLARRLNVSRAAAKARIENTKVNGVEAKASHSLRAGDIIEVGDAAVVASSEIRIPGSGPLPSFLYEDDDILVLDKPRGLSVHPGAGEETATLVDVLRAHQIPLSTFGGEERAGIVHRLDKDTSGAMIVCKTDAAHEKLADDFKARRVHKTYAALVCGVPVARGRIEAPIARHQRSRQKMAVSTGGKMAITEYCSVREWTKFALLEVRIFTGRTHQIRVHLAHLHHPVVGDERYGGSKRALQSAPSDEVKSALQDLEGQALHAAQLSFEHPISGLPIIAEAPLPPEIERIIAALDAA